MSDSFKITKFIKVEQPIGTFLICSISPQDLLKLSEPNPRKYAVELDNYIGIQRELDDGKISNLKDFIKTSDACFPNSIIGSLDSDFILKYTDSELEILTSLSESKSRKPIFIIDGQHRLASFIEYENKSRPFDLILTLFLGMDVPDQAYLFATINSKQKRLNPSLVQDLNSLFTLEMPEKIVHVITNLFNTQENSPWRGLIKTLGTKDENITEGIMSQYSFAKQVIELIYDPRDNNKLRKELRTNNNSRQNLKYRGNGLFWDLYKNKNEKEIYYNLLYYFKAIQSFYSHAWGNTDYILTKTTGYIALINLFEVLYLSGEVNFNDYTSVSKIMNGILKNISEEDLISDKYPSGIKGQKMLFKDLKSGIR